MANPVITNYDTAELVIKDAVHADDTVSAAAALTYAKGTILGRITSSGKLTHWAPGASDGSEVPVAVLDEEKVFAAASDAHARPLISGHVRKDKLVAHEGDTIDAGVLDALRSHTILAIATRQHSGYDNQ